MTKQILSHLQENKIDVFTLSELAFNLGITKKMKMEFRQAISELLLENKINKHKKKYKLISQIPLSPIVSGKKGLIEGIFDATPLSRDLSFAFVRTDQGDFFVSSEDTLNAYHNDKVAIEPFFKRGKSDYCKIAKVIDRANKELAGDIQTTGSKFIFICSNPKIHNWFEVSNATKEHLGKKVVLEVINWGNQQLSKPPVGKITEILGDSGNLDVEVLSIIRQFQLPLEFSPSQIEEAKRVSLEVTEQEIGNRIDFRNILTFTIDPSSAKDYDDAISIVKTHRGWRLYVHIADVAHYVDPSSAIFEEAIKRGNSYYFPKRVIPMLPEILSNKVCSLRPEEDKLTLTVVSDFDDQGRIIKQKLMESVIRSNIRLTYEEVDELFEGKPTDIPNDVISALNESRVLSTILSEQRRSNGYLFFDLPDVDYEYNEDGFVHLLTEADETESHKLIENFMLVANEYIAKQLTQKAPVTLYRIHDDPDPKRIDKLSDTLSHYGLKMPIKQSINHSLQALLTSMPTHEHHVVFDRMILRSLKKAEYSTKHIRHFGLAMDTYTHFTSPIRRLCDLVIHHLCKIHLLQTAKKAFTKKQLAYFAQVSSEKELVATEAERNVERIYNLSYMKSKIGDQYEGLIVNITNRVLSVRLLHIPISGILNPGVLSGDNWNYDDVALRLTNKRSGYYYQLLDKIKVQVQEVRDSVIFDLCNDEDAHIHVFQEPQGAAQQKQRKPKQHRLTKISRRTKARKR